MIDHHLHPQKFCDLTISYPDASSTSELVFRLIDAIGGLSNLTKAGAEDLYAGMCTDTGKFTYGANDPDLYVILSELLKKGIDKDKINRLIYNNFTEARFRLLGYILSEKLQVFPDLHATMFTLTRDEMSRFSYIKGDTEGVVNLPLEIKGTKLSIYMREDTEHPRIFVSLRSVDDFPANKVAADFFNGGGHLNAAGGQLQNKSMDEAVEIAKKALEAYADELKK
jgi:phosphoesterase RecJ-like protein